MRQFAAYGTLSGAAEQLHLSQPALSRNIKKLEEDLGVPLLSAGKTSWSSTKMGNMCGKRILRCSERCGIEWTAIGSAVEIMGVLCPGGSRLYVVYCPVNFEPREGWHDLIFS